MTTTYTTIQDLYNAELADALNDSTIIPEVLLDAMKTRGLIVWHAEMCDDCGMYDGEHEHVTRSGFRLAGDEAAFWALVEELEASQYQIARAEGPGYEGIIPDDELGELVIERAGEWVADLGWAETDDEALMGLSADRVEQLVAAAIGADPASCTATKTGDAGTIYRTWTVTVR